MKEENIKKIDNSKTYIDSICKLQETMFDSIYDFISDKYRKIILEKINYEKSILNKLSNREKEILEKYEIEKNEIDQKYFDKKSLNINNL
jgi:hypothetical protein